MKVGIKEDTRLSMWTTTIEKVSRANFSRIELGK